DFHTSPLALLLLICIVLLLLLHWKWHSLYCQFPFSVSACSSFVSYSISLFNDAFSFVKVETNSFLKGIFSSMITVISCLIRFISSMIASFWYALSDFTTRFLFTLISR